MTAAGDDFVSGLHLSEILEWEAVGDLRAYVRTDRWGWLLIVEPPHRLRARLAMFERRAKGLRT